MMFRPLFLCSLFLMATISLHAQEPVVQQAVYSDVSIPLSEMKTVKKTRHFWDKWKKGENEEEVPNKFRPVSSVFLPDTVIQKTYSNNSRAASIAPLINVDGTSNLSNVSQVTPPDPAGDVGPNHYVQVVNSMLQIFSKTGASLYGPVVTSTLWSGFSGNWDGHNNGDAIVLYDETADRWIITQFAIKCGTYPNYTQYEMVAVSTTPNPLGSYYRYAFAFDYMPDYPKLGVWQDGYYMAINRFNTNASGTPYIGAGACVMERSKMLTGDASAKMVYFKTETLGGTGSAAGSACWAMLPADCDGTLPAAGTPNYFVYINGTSELRLWALHTDWTTTTNSTFTYVTALPVAAYTGMGSGSVPEQGTLSLDGLGDRLMFRNQYRNFGSYETFVTCHSVNTGSSIAGIRWYEYRKTGSTFSLYQQSTYAPGDGKSRWMASIAMNSLGDIGMAYSVSSSTMFPSIYFTGRKAADALNLMTISEGLIQTGTVSMTSYSRWGDYSALNVDPADNTTFWTTQEYVGTYGGWCPWATKIASFKFANTPLIATLAPSSITTTTATLNGTINPVGLSSSYYFEWGTTTGYGNTTPTLSAGSGAVNVSVSAAISGLASSTNYHCRLVGTNSEGTSYGNDMVLSTVCSTLGSPFTENFTGTVSLPACWTQVDHQGSGLLWQFGTITAYTGYNPVLTGNYAYLNSDGYGTGKTENADLITPTLDLSNCSTVILKFNHYFRAYTGSSGTLSYSINNGSTWTTLQTFTATSATNPVAFNQTIAAAANQSQVKFRWNYTGTYGYYWAIDDIRVTTPGTWLGGTPGTPLEWNTAANWESGAVPTASTDVFIPAQSSLPTITTSGAVCNNLYILSGGKLTINPTYKLTVTGITTIY